MRPARLPLALATSLIAAAGLGLFAPAADARMVTVGSSEFKLTDEVDARFAITRRPPRGWHYEATVQVEDYSEREAAASGCTAYGLSEAYRGGRPATVTFVPDPSEDPAAGPGEWCPGDAWVVLYIQRDRTHSPKYSRRVAYSRMFSFVD